MNRRRQLLRLLLSAGPVLGLAPPVARSFVQEVRVLRIAAASDVQFALTEIAALFERETSLKLVLQVGASGNLVRQIRQGLAVDMFFSADEAYVFQLAEAGMTRDRGERYARGRLALLAPRNSTLVLDEQLAGVRAGLAAVQRFAIANPEHAPYGRAAREALQTLGLWEALRPKLVLGESVAQATQFVASGAAQAGITSLSLVRVPEVERATRHQVLPERLHPPLHQRLVVLKSAASGADRLLDFMRRPDIRELLRRHGFADAA